MSVLVYKLIKVKPAAIMEVHISLTLMRAGLFYNIFDSSNAVLGMAFSPHPTPRKGNSILYCPRQTLYCIESKTKKREKFVKICHETGLKPVLFMLDLDPNRDQVM